MKPMDRSAMEWGSVERDANQDAQRNAKRNSPRHSQLDSKRTANPGRALAFTLLELVIALAIAAILAAYAVPSWHAQVARSHRVDAAAAVYRAAQFVGDVSAWGAGNQLAGLPPGVDQAPQSGKAVYRLRMLTADDTNGGYAIQASPVESGPMQNDACGTFVLDATGLRTNRGANGAVTPTVEECWNTR